MPSPTYPVHTVGQDRTILVFGGTFDPPHRAHATLPPLVAEQLGCTQLLYVPAAVNPLKTGEATTEAHHRAAMLLLALADVPHAEICPLELERAGPSYTVDTLEALRHSLGADVSLRLLIGADQALQFHRWKEWRRIIELASPVVMLRPPWTEDAFRTALQERFSAREADEWMERIVHVPIMDISASEIRRRLAAGEPVDDLLDPAVVDYIRREHLYQAGAPST